MGVPGVSDRAERQTANSLNLIRFGPAEGFEMTVLQAAAALSSPHDLLLFLPCFAEAGA